MDVLSVLTPSPAMPSVSTGVVTVGPELARRLLSECHYARQRRLAEQRLRLYSAEMARGLWRLSELRLARTPDGHAYLINGYTRLSAVVTSGAEVPFVMVVVDVRDMDEVAAEYATMDSHRVRQTKDLLKGYDLENRLGLTLAEQERTARTAGVLSAGFQSARHLRFTGTIQFRLSYLLEWADITRELGMAMQGHTHDPVTTRIGNVPIWSVALITARFQPEKAAEFWNRVAVNDGLRRGRGDWILRDFLARLSTATVSEWPGMSRRAAACWNAYLEDREISFARATRPDDGLWSPIKITGTPYDGRQTIQLYGAGNLIPGTEPPGQRPEDIWGRAERGDFASRPSTEREQAAAAR